MNKLTIQEVADVVSAEGLGYAVLEHLSYRRIKDPHLQDMWWTAEQAMRKLDNHLEPYL